MGAKKRLLKMLSIFSLPLFISGCGPSLGVFEGDDGENYYDSFGDVKGLYDGGSKSYDIKKSLSNDTTINHFSWEKDEYKVETDPYLYLILPFEAQLKIQSIVLFFYTTENVTVELSAFYFVNETFAPQKIKYLSSPDTEIVDDHEEEIEYDDPKKETSIVNGTMSLYKEEWNSFVFGSFNQDGYNDGYLHTGIDGLLYLRIENNSGFNRDTMQSFSFTFINLFIRAV